MAPVRQVRDAANIIRLLLPSKCSELNPIENIC